VIRERLLEIIIHHSRAIINKGFFRSNSWQNQKAKEKERRDKKGLTCLHGKVLLGALSFHIN
jgi:hypothetical protein